jgi:hypothetical protein
LFVELCAGSAAVTLRLIGGPNARPPISYMGAKTGYAAAILAVLGLRSGQGADAVVLVEAGPWARAWRLLTTPEGCRAVAAVIRGWVGEDARALWDRLRAEPVPAGEAEAVGAWCMLQENSYGNKGPDAGQRAEHAVGIERSITRDVPEATGRAFAAYLKERRSILGMSKAQTERAMGTNGAVSWWEGDGGNSKGTGQLTLPRWPIYLLLKEVLGMDDRFDEALRPTPGTWTNTLVRPEEIAARAAALSALRWPPVHVVEGDVCGVRPEDVARWLVVNAGSRPGGTHTFRGPCSNRPHTCDGYHPSREELAYLECSDWPPTIIAQADVATVQPGVLPAGTVVYFDPDYAGTTGYKHTVGGKANVCEIAKRWSDAGATVCVSERVPLDCFPYHVDISACRVGQKRTFGATPEWLTLNREPAWLPERQGSLWDCTEGAA